MISVVCVYNRKDLLERYLLESLERQKAEHERILLDNTAHRFKSAAEALNKGGRSAKGKYVMFAHQDVTLPTSDWLGQAERVLDGLTDLGIAGVAGKAEKGHRVMTNIEHGEPPRPAGQIPISELAKVQTLDECIAIVLKGVFAKLGFDEVICDDWHLYVVDYCLSVKNLGLEAYVVPMKAYHLSLGEPVPAGYFKTLEKLVKKHQGQHKVIMTGYRDWDTSYPVLLQRSKTWRNMVGGTKSVARKVKGGKSD